MLLGSYLIADGIHLNDTARSSSVDTGEVGVGEEKVMEEFLETGQIRSCKIPLFKECKIISKGEVMSPSN